MAIIICTAKELLMLMLLSNILVASLYAITNQPDVFALQNLFTSLNSARQLTGWSSNGTDPCGDSWEGIQCSKQAITEIHLPGLCLTGGLGYRLDQLTSLIILDLSNNQISGSLPYQLPANLQQLNLGSNNFSGSSGNFPYSFTGMTGLTYLNMSNNQLSGSISDVFWHLKNLNTLDLSFNKLAGELPQSFSNLSKLSAMHLQNNLLLGNLNFLANLPLQDLDVENNHFTGWIPSTFSSIANLKVNGNNFSIFTAPPPPPFIPPPPQQSQNQAASGPSAANFDQQSTAANSSLGSSDTGSGLSSGAVAGITVAGVLAVSIVAFIIILFFLKPRRHIEDEQKRRSIAAAAMQTFTTPHARVSNDKYNNKLEVHPQEVPLKPPPAEIYKMVNSKDSGNKSSRRRTKSPIAAKKYSIADLQIATNSFSAENLIGEGSFGTVYKAKLPEKVVAVKKMDASVSSFLKEEDIRELVSNISSLHHPNITQLVGYCMEHGHCLLVYDYFVRGTLHDVLHSTDETRKGLTWNTRVKIALGTARALEYLHEVCLPSMIHKDFKSANILLDEELNPHLSDSGIAAFLQCPERQVSTQETGSFSYSVPEYAMSGAYTTKSDVYGFGVVMLELLTGREPFDSKKPRNEKSLVRWATPQLHDIDALTSMVDPALMGLYPVKSLSRFADIISLCVQPEPEFRPLMSEVVQSLVRLMQRANLNKRRLGDDLNSSDTQDTSDMSRSYSQNAS